MLINCTRRLYGYVGGSERISSAEYNPLFTWSGELFYDNKAKPCVVLRNLETGFPVMFRLADDFSVTTARILQEIRKAFLAQGYATEAIDTYMKEGEAVRFKQKSDQTAKKKIDALVAYAQKVGYEHAPSQLPLMETSNKRKKSISKVEMERALGEPIPEITTHLHLVIPLKVTLRLTPAYPVWRSFLVPPSFTMQQLHEVLQIGFDWEGEHLHEFRVGKHMHIRPKADIDNDWMDDTASYDEEEVVLQRVASSCTSFFYIYDFGDGWVHEIKIGKPVFLHEEPKAICTGGEGISPWEDCGGPYGYERMMDILADETHSEYSDILDWTGGTADRIFDKEYTTSLLAGV